MPEIVTDRIEAALNKIREQQPDFGRDKIASFSLQGRSRKRRRVLILSFAAILILACLFLQQKNIWGSQISGS